jgi:hypothetical protein
MGAMNISIDGKPAFTWSGDGAAIENILQALPDAAKAGNKSSAEELAVSCIFFLKEGKLDKTERGQMMGLIWFLLQQETGIPDRPGKLADYAANTDFDVDCETIGGRFVSAQVKAKTKLDS